jgi:hypothetical protein
MGVMKMRYIIRAAYRTIFQASRPYGQIRNYPAEGLDRYRAGGLQRYVRPSSVDESTRPYYRPREKPRMPYYDYYDNGRTNRRYLHLSLARALKRSRDEKHDEGFEDWVKLLYLPVTTYLENGKQAAKEKTKKKDLALMELKTHSRHYGFIICDGVMDTIVTWECLPDVDTVRQYLKGHSFPDDRLYSKEAFLRDVQKATGYIHLIVEKRETAEFICNLCCALIGTSSRAF